MSAADDVYKKQTFGQKLGFGKRPAVLVIDFQLGFTSAEALGGYNINDAIDNTAVLLENARKNGIPVAHVQFMAQQGGFDLGPFGEKIPRLREVTVDSPLFDFAEKVRPQDGEYVATKRHASAFFGTNLNTWLIYHQIDTLLIAGCTTSGCVRASVVDASGYGYRPMVVEQCVGDRAQAPHEANIFDMGQKYADIVSLDEASTYLASFGK